MRNELRVGTALSADWMRPSTLVQYKGGAGATELVGRCLLRRGSGIALRVGEVECLDALRARPLNAANASSVARRFGMRVDENP